MVSNDAQAALAQAQARITELEAQIVQEKSNGQRLSQEIESLKNENQSIKRDTEFQIRSIKDDLISKEKQNLDLASELSKTKAQRDGFSSKFDRLYSDPIVPGIVRGPAPFVTTDDAKHHPTLEAARAHLLGIKLNVSDEIAKSLMEKSDEVVTVLTGAGAKPK